MNNTNKSKLYLKLYQIVTSYAALYNYDFSKESDNKAYYIDDNHYEFTNNDLDPIKYAEVISLSYNILRELGLDVILKIKNKKEIDRNFNKILEYLDYLDIDYEVNNNMDNIYDKVIFEIYSDNSLLSSGGCKGSITMNNNIDAILNELDEDNISTEIDVNIITNNNEEKLKANIIMQDLRLNGVITDINLKDNFNIKQVISFNSEDLNKGLLKVTDNLTKEEITIPEDEIVDYILGVI